MRFTIQPLNEIQCLKHPIYFVLRQVKKADSAKSYRGMKISQTLIRCTQQSREPDKDAKAWRMRLQRMPHRATVNWGVQTPLCSREDSGQC